MTRALPSLASTRPKPVKAPGSTRQKRGDAHKELMKSITKYLDGLGCYWTKIAGGAYQKPGLPDLFAGIRPAPAFLHVHSLAQFVAIEVKTGTGVLTEKQREEREKIVAGGCHYILCHSLEEFESALLAAGLLESPALLWFGGE